MHGHRINSDSPDKPNIWRLLKYFWTEEHVERWYKNLFDPQKDDRFAGDVCYNMISLSPDAHRYHWSGYFALKPVKISEDKKCLSVKLYWLPKVDGPISSSVSRLCDPPSQLEGNPSQGPGLARLFNYEMPISGCFPCIKSGDEIKLTTEDPENCPLPHWELLEMQWILNRVVVMSGDVDIDVEDGFDYYEDFDEEDVDKNDEGEDDFAYDDGYYDDGYYDDEQVSMMEGEDIADPEDVLEASDSGISGTGIGAN